MRGEKENNGRKRVYSRPTPLSDFSSLSVQLTVFHTLLQVILRLVKTNCSFSVSLSSFVKFRSMREVSIAAAAANKCQRISVSYANILPGWKRTHFTAINVVFAGKLLQIRSR